MLLTGRDAARGASTVAAIRADGGQAEFFPTDFASLASVRALAETVGQRCDRLDVLVNNAGLVGGPARRLTVDGHEETFAVNHLATFLLTETLRPLLLAAGSARVVTVSSDAHRMLPQIEFDNLQSERRYKPFRAYGQSKLANILFTYELARRMAGTGVAATCLHPGVVRTRIWGAAGGGILGGVPHAGEAVHAFRRAQRALGHAAGVGTRIGGHHGTIFQPRPRGALVAGFARWAGGGPALGGEHPADGTRRDATCFRPGPVS